MCGIKVPLRAKCPLLGLFLQDIVDQDCLYVELVEAHDLQFRDMKFRLSASFYPLSLPLSLSLSLTHTHEKKT
jgi:hypothetical protein